MCVVDQLFSDVKLEWEDIKEENYKSYKLI